ncbi:hypothetical protein DY000_02061428 [Brassica cretica]|uniref:Ubiquitin-like protease family profile domain-containing protein n=1 Tax=Brassica cretica TaxID=69181 RepID=A0ABQ7AVM4_BRACR|nr:hypothetical protein DY000_02061428 [Brassica cretica]
MFPKWEFDVEDTPEENIIKLMFVKKPWKWTMDCWEVTVKEDSPRPRKKARKDSSEEASEEAAGVASEEAAAVASEEAGAEASEEVHMTVGGLTKEDIKTMFKDIVDVMREGFGTCLKEIKYLSERVEAVEKKVGITTKRKGTSAQNNTPQPKPTLEPGSESVNGTNAGKKSLPEDKGPDVPADASSSKDKAPEPSLVLLDKNQSTVSDLQKEDARYLEKRDAALALCRAKSDRTRKLAASKQSPYTANSTAKVIIPNKKLYPGYNPFAPTDKKKLKELADWLKTCPHYRTPLDKKPHTSRTWWFQIPWTSLEWLEDCPFTYERPTNIPPARAGDCGVYSLKYIECHALGINFSKKDFAKPNGKTMRDKMAVDIFQELPDAHEFENKDNDANLGAYEE